MKTELKVSHAGQYLTREMEKKLNNSEILNIVEVEWIVLFWTLAGVLSFGGGVHQSEIQIVWENSQIRGTPWTDKGYYYENERLNKQNNENRSYAIS